MQMENDMFALVFITKAEPKKSFSYQNWWAFEFAVGNEWQSIVHFRTENDRHWNSLVPISFGWFAGFAVFIFCWCVLCVGRKFNVAYGTWTFFPILHGFDWSMLVYLLVCRWKMKFFHRIRLIFKANFSFAIYRAPWALSVECFISIQPNSLDLFILFFAKTWVNSKFPGLYLIYSYELTYVKVKCFPFDSFLIIRFIVSQYLWY